ncbi:hypothetical protein A2U01_0107725, partial [Trifolium medium]|nr:hypothetical protein [Trifolium medium]
MVRPPPVNASTTNNQNSNASNPEGQPTQASTSNANACMGLTAPTSTMSTIGGTGSSAMTG